MVVRLLSLVVATAIPVTVLAQQQPGGMTGVVGTWTATGKPGEKLALVFKANNTWSQKSSVAKFDPRYDAGKWTLKGTTVTMKAKEGSASIYILEKGGTVLKPKPGEPMSQFFPIYKKSK